MLNKILDFRLRQFWRVLKGIGAGYFVMLVLVCFGFFMGLVEAVVRSETMWGGLIGVLIVASVHFGRKDTNFLRLMDINRPKLFFGEYILLTIPLVGLFLVGHNAGAILIQTLGVIVVAFLPTPELDGQSFSNSMDFKWLPNDAFEARSFLRKNVVILGGVYLISLLAAKFIVIPIVMIIILMISFISFFDEVEGKELFEVAHFRKGILTHKVPLYLLVFHLMLSPLVILFLLLHLQYWYIILAALFVGSTLVIFNIMYKYANYSPYRKRVYNSMASSIFLGFAMIPFLYPVTILYLFYYWYKARKNIKLFYAQNN